jgi:hypothetical protein
MEGYRNVTMERCSPDCSPHLSMNITSEASHVHPDATLIANGLMSL